MCGIFAVYHSNGFNNDKIIINNNEINNEINNNLTPKDYINILLDNARLLKHRGTIDNYKIINNKLLFYHNRLAINDLSNQGLQPILNNFICVIVNGEIYNYNELYDHIKENLPDYKFKSKSDSEILIPLYLLYGSAFINKINGMFSFVMYDMKKNILLAARDPFGITSLYYATDNNRIIFSSELKSLINLSNNIKIFLPGKLFINNNLFTFYKPNWLTNRKNNTISLPKNELSYEDLKNNLVKSVYSHIKLSDQPLGFLLSGGLDSSLIVGIASYLKKSKLINNEIKTFTIGLDGGKDIAYAESVAKELKTIHTTYTFTFDEVIENLEDIIYLIETYDITTVRASICNYLLIKKIKQDTDLKVLISGEGSDEIFGGYLYFHKCPSEEEMQLELIDKVINLHKYDCLRSHKSGMANTIEVRVPFLDKDFVNYVMELRPKYKMINTEQPIEKYILRKAFDTNQYLPNHILYRQKEQFSDGISNNENNLIDKLKNYADELISDDEFDNRHLKYSINTPISKEHMLYRQIFEKKFNNNINTILTVDHNAESIACSTKRGLSWLNLDTDSKLNDPSGKSIIDIYQN
jgi:asparagine synthase (glutamine-hydrolysing)